MRLHNLTTCVREPFSNCDFPSDQKKNGSIKRRLWVHERFFLRINPFTKRKHTPSRKKIRNENVETFAVSSKKTRASRERRCRVRSHSYFLVVTSLPHWPHSEKIWDVMYEFHKCVCITKFRIFFYVFPIRSNYTKIEKIQGEQRVYALCQLAREKTWLRLERRVVRSSPSQPGII